MLVLVCKESPVSVNKIQNNWISGLVKHTIGSIELKCLVQWQNKIFVWPITDNSNMLSMKDKMLQLCLSIDHLSFECLLYALKQY